MLSGAGGGPGPPRSGGGPGEPPLPPPRPFRPGPSAAEGRPRGRRGAQAQARAAKASGLTRRAGRCGPQAYAGAYAGRSRLQRLLFVAEKAKEAGGLEGLELEALRLAAQQLLDSDICSTESYKEVVEKIGGRLGEAYNENAGFIQEMGVKVAAKKGELDQQLSRYKANAMKESIRTGYSFLGDFYYETGDLAEAFKAYNKTRDYCTAPEHILLMCISQVKVSIGMENYIHVLNFVTKAENAPVTGGDGQTEALGAVIQAAAGVAQIDSRRYSGAAKKFTGITCDPEVLAEAGADILSARDVALYGGLCSLASLDRQKLHELVIKNNSFRAYLETFPQVREVVDDFYQSRYSSCLEGLEKLRAQLGYDLYLHNHVDRLYKEIRDRALIQYTLPYSSIHLDNMAQAFGASSKGLRKELAALISSGSIRAKIDSQKNILYATSSEPRNLALQKISAVGEEYQQGTKALLLRASLIKHRFVKHHPDGFAFGRDGRDGRESPPGLLPTLGGPMPLSPEPPGPLPPPESGDEDVSP